MVKNHMSSISAGLEATIKEWFTQHDTSGGTATAVETSEKVDLEKVKAKAPRKRKAGAKDGSDILAPPATEEVVVEEEPAPEAPNRAKKVEPTIITPAAPEPEPVAP